MANAADYLRVSTTQIVTDYKLRTRAAQSSTFTLTNTATDQILSVVMQNAAEGITINPSQVTLQPNQTATVTVTYDTAYLETLNTGIVTNTLNLVTTATAIVSVPVPPPPPPQPTPTPVPLTPVPQPTPVPLTPVPQPIAVGVTVLPSSNNFGTVNQTYQYTANLNVNGQTIPATFNWSLSNSNGFNIDTNTGNVTSTVTGQYSANVIATVNTPVEYRGTTGTAIAAANISGNVGGIIYGCTSASAYNYNSGANTDDGSCIPKIYGCTDRTAPNFNPNANTNDGSCAGPVYTLQISNPATVQAGRSTTVTAVVLKDGVPQPNIGVTFDVQSNYAECESAPPQTGPIITTTTTTVSGGSTGGGGGGSSQVGTELINPNTLV